MTEHPHEQMSQVATEIAFIEIEWTDRLTSEALPALLDELQGSLGRLEEGYTKSLYSRLSAVAALAEYFKANPRDWESFCGHKSWLKAKGGRPSMDDIDDALGFVMRFSFGFSRKASQNANKYKHAIEPLLKTCRTENLAEEIENAGGIVALLKRPRADDENVGADEVSSDDSERESAPNSTKPDDAAAASLHTESNGEKKRKTASRQDSDLSASGGYFNVDLDLVTENVDFFRQLTVGARLRLSVEITKVTPDVIGMKLFKYKLNGE